MAVGLRDSLAMALSAPGLLLATACAGPSQRGVLPVRSQHPAQLQVLRAEADVVAARPAGSVGLRADAGYSSLFLSGGKGGNTLAMDGEYLRARLLGQVGLGADLELAVELPVAHTSGGFLDSFIIGWHDFFGFPDQERQLVPNDRYRVDATRNGVTAMQVEAASLELMDVPMHLKWAVLPAVDGGFGLALRASLEAPTGDQRAGFGNGGLDWGGSVLAEWRPGPVAVHAHLGHAFVATPDRAALAGLAYQDVGSGGLGVVLPLGAGLEALGQVEWETSTLRELGFDRAARDQVLLWVGARADLGRGFALECAIGEDLAGFVAPDFTAFAGVSWQPGRGR